MSTLRHAAQILTGRRTEQVDAAAGKRATEYLGVMNPGGLSGVNTFSGGDIMQLTAGEKDFSASAIAYRCLAFIAQNLASVDLGVFASADDEPDETDPIAMLWNRGTDGAPYSARVVREVLFARAELTGEALAFIDRGDTGAETPRGLHPIFDRVDVHTKLDDRGLSESVTGYVVHKAGRRIPLLPSEVLWLRYPHPTKPWGALAPWKAALYANEVDAYARAWQRGEFRNGARPGSVIMLGDLEAEQHERAVAAYHSKVAGPGNAGKSLLISGPGKASVNHLSLTPAEMSYIETRLRSAEEVMLAFGLRKDVLFGESTYENQRAAKTAAWSETLLGKLDVFSSEIDRQLVPDRGRTAGWLLDNIDALRESVDALYERAQKAAYPDIVTLDEARAMIGLDPLPGGLGQVTMTPYRERARLELQAEFMASITGGERSSVRQHLVRINGATRTIRAGARTEKRVTSAAKIGSMYARHERVGVRAIERLADRQLKDVLRKLKDATRVDRLDGTLARWAGYAASMPATMPLPGAPDDAHAAVCTHDTGQRMSADDLLSVTFWTDETKRALEDFMTGAWLEGGEYAATTFGLSFDMFDDRVLAEMAARLGVLAGKITETTRAIIDSQILANGAAAGESIDDLADRLRGTFTDLAGWRARLIARTEVVGGMNASAHNVAAASGLVVTREWLATHDARTRPSHERQNGHRLQGTEGTYPNGCRYPGDPEAPASETVQCRCVELFETD